MTSAKSSRIALAEKDTERRRRILHAAEKCFLAQGFHAATTDMIQEAAGVSKSTLYRYFRSKDLLFEATVEAGGQTFLDQLGKVRQKAGDPSGFLNELGRQLLAALLSERALSLVRLMIHESNRFPGVVRRFYMSGPKGVLDIVERFMSEAHARGELRVENPSRAAEQFMGMIRGETYLRCLLNIVPPPDQADIRSSVAATVESYLAAYRHPAT